MSFKTKLLGLIGFLCSVSILIGVVSFRGLAEVAEAFHKITDDVMPNQNLINSMYLEYRSVRINLRSLGLPNLSAEDSKKYIAEVEKSIENYEKLDAKYLEIPFLPGEQELHEKVNNNWKSFKALGIRAINLYKQGGADNMAQLNKIFLVDCVDEAKRMDEAIDAVKQYHEKNGEVFMAEATGHEKETNQMTLIVSAIGVLLGMGIGFAFATKVSAAITHVAHQLASNADQVAAASSQIASSSQQLSEASTEQASSLEETAASLEEITSMISKATENAQSTSETSSESHKKAEEGRGSVDQMLSSMDEISQSNEAILTQINESNRQMSDIVKVIQDIGNRTKVINEIVFQTKLLSFNASVEAARAGEHGKGFAVVAEEVGNLAQMSGNAAKEITDMLDASISKVEGIVRDTQQKVESLVQSGKEKVETGVTVARQCSDVLNEIVQNVSRVSGLSQEISQASKEQAQGVNEINKAMSQLDTVTQQNAATSEEAASAAEELSAQAESLKASVEELMAVISGNRTSLATTTVAPRQTVAAAPKVTKSNIVHIKAAKPKASKPASEKHPKVSFQMASGGDESSTPNRDDDGFKDV
ncbi:MAG: methyl-accepting chemotaxis protein [Bdellovibrionaceae bacterium]|nr:methyl-accepting chemotaxis protein [Pseudobdellovibrionaceae bacterium]